MTGVLDELEKTGINNATPLSDQIVLVPLEDLPKELLNKLEDFKVIVKDEKGGDKVLPKERLGEVLKSLKHDTASYPSLRRSGWLDTDEESKNMERHPLSSPSPDTTVLETSNNTGTMSDPVLEGDAKMHRRDFYFAKLYPKEKSSNTDANGHAEKNSATSSSSNYDARSAEMDNEATNSSYEFDSQEAVGSNSRHSYVRSMRNSSPDDTTSSVGGHFADWDTLEKEENNCLVSDETHRQFIRRKRNPILCSSDYRNSPRRISHWKNSYTIPARGELSPRLTPRRINSPDLSSHPPSSPRICVQDPHTIAYSSTRPSPPVHLSFRPNSPKVLFHPPRSPRITLSQQHSPTLADERDFHQSSFLEYPDYNDFNYPDVCSPRQTVLDEGQFTLRPKIAEPIDCASATYDFGMKARVALDTAHEHENIQRFLETTPRKSGFSHDALADISLRRSPRWQESEQIWRLRKRRNGYRDSPTTSELPENRRISENVELSKARKQLFSPARERPMSACQDQNDDIDVQKENYFRSSPILRERYLQGYPEDDEMSRTPVPTSCEYRTHPQRGLKRKYHFDNEEKFPVPERSGNQCMSRNGVADRLLKSLSPCYDIGPGENEEPLKCACSAMESHFLQMTECAYKNIRRKDSTSASFEQFTRELTQTNSVLKESVGLLKSIQEICTHKQKRIR